MDLKEKILDILNAGPYLEDELYTALGDKNPAFEAALTELIGKCSVVRTKSGSIGLPHEFGLYCGRLEINRKGFGFVRREGGDIYIAKEDLGGAMHRQTVLVRTEGKEDRLYGRVIRISSEPFFITGTYSHTQQGSFVVCDNPVCGSVHVPKKAAGAEYGDKVVAQVIKAATKYRSAEGVVTEVLGAKGTKGVDILSAARSFGLYEEFPPAVISEAEQVSSSPMSLEGREPLFDKVIFTIDGEDAKDLDDAVSLEHLENGNSLLGVHIADVSNYVKESSALDKEALRRATSVYLIDRVIPMLPKQLSNGICSLNEGETRLTLSCFMEIDGSGTVISSRLANTAIRTLHRMTYTDVNAMIYGDKDTLKKYSDIAHTVAEMDELAQKLRKRRFSEGAIDFDIPEAKIELDAGGKPVKLAIRKHDRAEMLIEEFMICANNSVATEYFYREIPFLYRVHEKPDPAKLRELSIFLKNAGFTLKGNEPHGHALQKVLDESADSPAGSIIKRLMLRSMKKARYSPVNMAHFGLASPAYSHFTSPIRRYPDLQIHRIIKQDIGSGLLPRDIKKYEDMLPDAAAQCNDMELNALEAERTVDDIKKAEYMAEHIGESFKGIISGVTGHVLFVELENTVEGVLPLSEMQDDFYEYFEKLYCVIGKRTKKRYSLGDSIDVELCSADAATGRIEFKAASSKKRRSVLQYRRRKRR